MKPNFTFSTIKERALSFTKTGGGENSFLEIKRPTEFLGLWVGGSTPSGAPLSPFPLSSFVQLSLPQPRHWPTTPAQASRSPPGGGVGFPCTPPTHSRVQSPEVGGQPGTGNLPTNFNKRGTVPFVWGSRRGVSGLLAATSGIQAEGARRAGCGVAGGFPVEPGHFLCVSPRDVCIPHPHFLRI